MREGLQAMSLVNSKERTGGFGAFPPQLCARQVVGEAACASRASTQTSGGRWPSHSDALESSGHHGRDGATEQMGCMASPAPTASL